MHEFCQPIDLKSIKTGSTILIRCDRISHIFRTNNNYIIGTVSEVFDAGDPIGFQIDIFNKTQWWRWIPAIDGGHAFTRP